MAMCLQKDVYKEQTKGRYCKIREHLLKKECFLSGIARITPPISGNLYTLFADVETDVLRV